ncbi:transducin beta-like protein 2 isoform X2 [Centruroides sculpturatus]|uniref:transducin beta-like protein 2 isoform X2 n=1 Tax=Centruroides sculpturatus TaxID=218467 RepID=UPI000C6E5446|nr:transducin beta-like protein 2 isoform X2 [Centruroides sculpturatus]
MFDTSRDCNQELEKKDKGKNIKKKKNIIDKHKEVKAQFTHPWLITTLKGHSGNILDMDYSNNGKYLISCDEERTVMLWNTKTLSQKNNVKNQKDIKSVRINIEYDHATQVKWSPDGKAFIICQANGNAIQVYRLSKRDDGMLGNAEPIIVFPKKHKSDIINIGIACTGQYMMSCSKDTTIIIWDLKGEVLATIDTLHINNYYACVSYCGRFVASSGFTPDVKVWDVCFNKSGEFKEVRRAFELKGHSSGVYCFSFSNDSTRMASVSKDGTWKIWDTNIEYQKGQEPYLLKTGNFDHRGPCLVALSPDGRTVALAMLSTVTIYSGVTGEKQSLLENIHEEPIAALHFSADNQYLSAAAGKHVRIFYNVLGYKNAIEDLEIKKISATGQAIRERLQSQIDDAKKNLESVEGLLKR